MQKASMPFGRKPDVAVLAGKVRRRVKILGLFINVFVISATTTALQNMDAKNMAGRQKVETISKYLLYKKVHALEPRPMHLQPASS